MSSAKKRAQKPSVSTAMAIIPAKDPSPTATTKRSAQARSGTALTKPRAARTSALTARPTSAPRAARSARGSAATVPSAAPATAIWRVSTIWRKSLGRLSVEGGQARPRKSARRGPEEASRSAEKPAPSKAHTRIAAAPA